MSNRQATISDVKFEPVPDQGPRRPGQGLLILGAIYPVAVIVFELLSQMCANALFDPMPTGWHVAVVGLVPASNLLLWLALQKRAPRHGRLLAFANGAAMSIAAFYVLLFLPLLPMAVVGVIFIFGLLPFAPLASFVSALKLRKALRERHTDDTLIKPLLAGLAAGLALLLVLDVRAAATRHGIQLASSSVPSDRTRGLALLRTLGDDDLLLRLCYGAAGQSTGLLSAFVIYSNNSVFDMRRRLPAVSPEIAREVYYRVHGTPFNARPAPFENGKWSSLADFQFDDDHGGTQVGGRLKGLSLIGSRLDGSISSDDAVAYLEWTVEFRNTDLLDREARVQFALPPRGVVSRATLWINGEEREAAYAGRGAARAAYQRVAVQQRRDPLLVTTKGADRVLAQAFPVPRNGTLKFKLGISAPLEIVDAGKARLTLPALVDRNFSFGPELSHSIWIESKQPLAASAPGLAATRPDAKLFRLAGSLADRDLSGARPAITVDRNADVVRVAARFGESEPVVQEITRSSAQPTGALVLVIDGSARLADSSTKLIKALSALPSPLKVGVIIASEPAQSVSLAPWSDAQKQRVVKLLRSTSFSGGQDNAPALAEALGALEAEANATLLWVHGPQPISFRGSAGRLEQAAARLSHLPDVVLYSVEPGPNELLPDAPLGWGAHALPQTGSLTTDLSAFFARVSGQAPTLAITRNQDQPVNGLPKGSDHIARLWANDRVLELMRADPSNNRAAAVELAAKYQLITPVSGAVVLENQQQFDEAALTPATQGTLPTVPTVPEPHEWALMLIACAALMGLAWRNRQRFAVAA